MHAGAAGAVAPGAVARRSELPVTVAVIKNMTYALSAAIGTSSTMGIGAALGAEACTSLMSDKSQEMVVNLLEVQLAGTDKADPLMILNFVQQLPSCSLHVLTYRKCLGDWFRLPLRVNLMSGPRLSMLMLAAEIDFQAAEKQKRDADDALGRFSQDAWVLAKRQGHAQAAEAARAARAAPAPAAAQAPREAAAAAQPGGGAASAAAAAGPGAAAPAAAAPRARMDVDLPEANTVDDAQIRQLCLDNSLPCGLVARFAEMQRQVNEGVPSEVGSDAGSDPGDLAQDRADELAALRKRSLEGALADADQTRMENLMLEKASSRSAKKVRRVQRGASASIKELVKPAVA
ncbi:unnamed protein product, partial [Prorocentrum cordatum]